MAKHILIIITLIAAFTFMPAMQNTASARIELSDIDTQTLKIEQRGNVIIVTGAAGKTLRIYDITGVEKKAINIEGQEKRIDLSQLTKGIYFVKVGNESKKISISGK